MLTLMEGSKLVRHKFIYSKLTIITTIKATSIFLLWVSPILKLDMLFYFLIIYVKL